MGRDPALRRAVRLVPVPAVSKYQKGGKKK
nr:MAG TPA: hypothetical protein [Caudoviricetes sp.]